MLGCSRVVCLPVVCNASKFLTNTCHSHVKDDPVSCRAALRWVERYATSQCSKPEPAEVPSRSLKALPCSSRTDCVFYVFMFCFCRIILSDRRPCLQAFGFVGVTGRFQLVTACFETQSRCRRHQHQASDLQFNQRGERVQTCFPGLHGC